MHPLLPLLLLLQQTAAGSVHLQDATGRPISSATATCSQLSVHSDLNGNLTLPCPTALRITAPGFAPLTLVPGQSLAILSPATVQTHVEITAPLALPIGETARTTYTLSTEDLHDYPAVTLDDALRQHAGFELFRRAPSRIANPTSEGISLRGLGSTAASRTLVLVDGAPFNDPFGGYIHWNELPTQTVQSVELVSGGGSDLYGSSAMAGVIDLTPQHPTEAAPTFFLQALGGSQSTSSLASTLTLPYTLLAAESLRTAGYIPTDPAAAGPVDTPANVRSQAYRLELGRRALPTKRLFLTANLLNESRNNGTPLQTNGTRLYRYLTGYDSPQSLTRSTTALRLFGSAEAYRQSFSAINSPRTSETLTRLQRVHTQELGATAVTTVRFHRVAAVFGADARDIRAFDDETPIARNLSNGLADTTARQRFLGGFGELLAAAGPWSLAASLRADRAANLTIQQFTQSTATAPVTATALPDRTEIVLSPRLGLIRTFGPRTTLHASAFRAFRTPTINELYRTGQVGQQITLANPALVSERATGVEAGLQTSFRRLTGNATYFWTAINRPVATVFISQTPTTLTNRRQNLGQIVSQGIEASAALQLTHIVRLQTGYQFANATVTKFSAQPTLIGNQIPQVPNHSFTAQLRAASPRLGEFTLATRAASHAFDDSANQFPLAPYFQLDASARHTLPHTADRLAIQFLAQNLTAQRQQVSRTPILTLGTPFFAQAGLTLRLAKP